MPPNNNSPSSSSSEEAPNAIHPLQFFDMMMGESSSSREVLRSVNIAPLQGNQVAQEYLRPAKAVDFVNLFRMTQETFRRLVSWLQNYGGLRSTVNTSVDQKVMVFLRICAFNETQRVVADIFSRAQRTVGSIFHEVLASMLMLNQAFVKLPDPTTQRRPERAGYDDMFADCLGKLARCLLSQKPGIHTNFDRVYRWNIRTQPYSGGRGEL